MAADGVSNIWDVRPTGHASSKNLQTDSERLQNYYYWLPVDLRVGSCLALFYIYQMNRVNSRNVLCHNDSITNIVKGIIIIIIIKVTVL